MSWNDPRTAFYLLAAIALGVWLDLLISTMAGEAIEKRIANIEKAVGTLVRSNDTKGAH